MRAAWNHAHFFRHTRNVSNSKKAGKCENNSRNAYAHTHSVREREKKFKKRGTLARFQCYGFPSARTRVGALPLHIQTEFPEPGEVAVFG